MTLRISKKTRSTMSVVAALWSGSAGIARSMGESCPLFMLAERYCRWCRPGHRRAATMAARAHQLAPSEVPGLVVVGFCVALAFVVSGFVDVSPLVAGVLLGVIAANTGTIRPSFRPGFSFAARRLLRVGIVFLGLRLSVEQVRELGIAGAIAVVVVVVATFVGVQLLARALGLSPGLGLLTATGFSICGASAVAAMEPLSDADQEETAYAIGLVTLCGTLSIAVLPALGHLLDMSTQQFGAFAGAAVHDVGQVTATASAYAEESLAPATLVKLTRVILLAPLVAGVGLWKRRTTVTDPAVRRPPIIPFFVAAFLAAIALRATGWLSDDALSTSKRIEQIMLTAGMFGLGAGVEFARLRRLGGRPLVLGLGSWALVAGVALAASYAVA
jgi:uncharacterized integral membrane protein (TIGR00698 family)